MKSEHDPDNEACCRVCARNDGKIFHVNDFTWFRCKECGTVQKVITGAQYRALNPSYDPGQYLDSRSREEIARFLDVDEKARVLKRALKKYGKVCSPQTRGRFLDVGCGMGGYMLAAQRLGFDVLGFEPSKEHARVASTTLGLPVVPHYFEAERVGQTKFDLIMLSHVIEHIFRPADFLADLIKVLRPGGVLIVATPNVRSFVARLTGRFWPMLKPLDHVTLICERAYSHFGVAEEVDIYHHSSELSYEFAATILAVAKAKLRAQVSAASSELAPSKARVLQETNLSGRFIRGVLTFISLPALAVAVATDTQACLTSTLVRRGNSQCQ